MIDDPGQGDGDNFLQKNDTPALNPSFMAEIQESIITTSQVNSQSKEQDDDLEIAGLLSSGTLTKLLKSGVVIEEDDPVLEQ